MKRGGNYSRYFLVGFLLITLLIFFLQTINATTYYVDASRPNDLGNGLTWATAKQTPNSPDGGLGLLTSPGDILKFAAGTYNRLNLNAHNFGNSTDPIIIRDADPNNLSDVGYTGRVIFSTAVNAHILDIRSDNITIKNLEFTGADNGKFNVYITNRVNVVLDNIHVYDPDPGGGMFNSVTTKGLLINNSLFEGSGNLSFPYDFDRGYGTIQNSIFRASENAFDGTKRFSTSTTGGGNWTFLNCLLTGASTETIQVNNNSIVYLNNSLILGNGGVSTTYTFSVSPGGALYADHSMITGNWAYPENINKSGGYYNSSNEIPVKMPKFVSPRRRGIVSFTIDDADMTYWEGFNTNLSKHNYSFTMMVTQEWFQRLNTNYESRIQALLRGADGIYNTSDDNDIGLHTYSHPQLTNINAFNISYRGSDINATLNITLPWLTITSSGGADNYGPLNLTSSSYDTIDEVCTYLNSTNKYNCTSNIQLSTGIGSKTLSTSLGDVYLFQGINKTSYYRVTLNQTRFFQDEITNPKLWLENLLNNASDINGYSIKSFSYPFADFDTNVINTLSNNSLFGSRGGDNTLRSFTLSNFSIYTIISYNPTSNSSIMEEEVFTACMGMEENGMFLGLMFHDANGHNYSAIDALAGNFSMCPNVDVMTFANATNYIRNSGIWSSSDANRTYWNRTFTDNSNYSLQFSSPLIDAGQDVGLTTDILGNPIYGTPDIGPYEYQPPYTVGVNQVNITGNIRVYGNGKYRYTTTNLSSIPADINFYPSSSGWNNTNYSNWFDVQINNWSISGTQFRNWTEISSVAGNTNITHIVGNLSANITYEIYYAKNGTARALLGTFTTNSSGHGVFNYTYGYSNVTFDLQLDSTAPPISILSPANKTGDTDGNVTFNFNVTDLNNVNCSLIINRVINSTNTSVTRNIVQNFTLNNLAAGIYNWSINCTDAINNKNNSETRIFSVIKTTTFTGATTDLNNVNVSNITNLVIESSNYGKINFSQSVDLSAGADINSYVNVSQNRIEINSSALPALNKSATLVLYNLSFSNPTILKDGLTCPDSICTEVSYSGGNFTFSVTQFSVYSAIETPVISSVATSSTTSGGGAIYWPTFEQMNKGFEKNLGVFSKIIFELNNKSYTIKIEKVKSSYVEISISPENLLFNLSIGDSKKINFDKDNFYDLKISLNKIINSQANISVIFIHEQISFNQTIPEKEEKGTEEQEEAEKGIFEENILGRVLIETAVIIIILAILFFIIIRKKKDKRMKMYGY